MLKDTDSTKPTAPKQYKVPGRSEDPTLTFGMLQRFLIDFHELNDMPIPKGFWERTKLVQLLGMYLGMKENGYFKNKIERPYLHGE